MRRLVPALFFISIMMAVLVQAGCQEQVIKKPAVAGAFYPAESATLQRQVDTFLQNASVMVPQQGRLVALISPHAGYIYSGQVAAHGYKALKGLEFDTVVLVGGAHRAAYTGASVYTEGLFETPLGMVPVDEEMARSLLSPEAHVTFYPQAYEGEHSLEVQLPFLQTVLGEFEIVPILISRPTQQMYARLADMLAQAASRQGKRVLLVASTDLSHYHPYDQAVEKDHRTIEALERISVDETQRLLASGEGEMCGGYAVMLVTEVARRLGANRAEVFAYQNSGDVTGDRSNVVGYVSMALYAQSLGDAERGELLDLARRSVRATVLGEEPPVVESPNSFLKTDGAAFVTINRNGRLRGCIGHVVPVEPLYLSVVHNARAAAQYDPRFKPVAPEELDELTYEVSVLSPMVPVADVEQIKIGSHGLFIRQGGSSGLLLPQVPVEQGWDRDEFLAQVCVKAGLAPNAWQNGARLWSFTAEVIH